MRLNNSGGRTAKGIVEDRLFYLPEGQRVYAIGDVHGRFDLLFHLMATIKSEEATRTSASTTIVLLGDLIDRGPHSAEVVQYTSQWDKPWAKIIALRGNHEDKLVRLLEGDSVHVSAWLAMGGLQTLLSYGISEETIRTAQTGALIEAARSHIPIKHQRWLRSLPSHWRCGDYLFVHAGLRPSVPILDQQDRDLMTIRGEFLESEVDHGALVIHGHSVKAEVDRRVNRIGIDTGAWHTGKLTAIGVEGSQAWFITYAGAPGTVPN